MKLAEQVVVFGHCALPLEDLNEHARLIVGVRREGLRLLRGDGRVPLDEFRHDATSCLEAHGERRDVQQEQVLHLRRSLPSQNGGLHGGTVSHGLIGVDGLAGLFPVEELLDHGLDLRDARGPAHQHHLMDVALVDTAVPEALLHGPHRIAEVVHVELLEARTGEGARVVDPLEERIDLYCCLSRG
mmetsp:Transcript_29706/g.88331  ORF Transcript_29706/g.88331 Transcript_29706/m.88331 type:complete len:186 (-) Transcript_29706:931-1488(-)